MVWAAGVEAAAGANGDVDGEWRVWRMALLQGWRMDR
jgi:hypothetical protein